MWKQLTLSYTICWIIFSYYGPKVSCLDELDCDFETGFCNWDQSSEDELDWTRISGATSTNNSTLDGYDRPGGFYAYIDTSTGDVGKDYRAWLISPGKTNGTYCFSLWYYMYGKHVYTLKVFKSFNGWTRLFQMLGSKGKRWYLTSIDISSTSWFNIIIFGRLNNVDSSNYSIIAIDDISMFPGNCPTECDDPTPIFGSVDSEIFTPGSVARIACTDGYTLKGKSSITCLANGTWSSKPECHPIDCLMPNFANGSIVNMSEGTTFNSSLLLACDMGYRLQGITYITCQANGNWSKIPTCLLINCGNPIPVSAYANSTNFQYKSQIEITCNPGYTIVGNSSIICQANGNWSNNPVCEPIDCGNPIPVSGYTNSTNFQYKSQIEITCITGYTVVGNSSIICQANGNWSNIPLCEPIDCGNPIPVSGYTNSTNFQYKSQIEITCITGYTVVGNSSIICQANGNWSNIPLCEPIDCGDPIPVSGFANSTNFQYKSQIQISCSPGYIIVGNSSIICQANGNWSNNPVCEPIDCGNPIPVSGYTNSTNFQYKSQIEITCITGYTVVGNSSIICQANGNWSNIPLCEPIDCGDPIPVSGFANSTNFQYKSQIQISCSPGYTIVGNSSIICQASGNWSNNPVCEAKDCFTPPVPHGIISGIVKHTTYNQTVRLDCADGYKLSGNRLVTCQSDGNWSSLPECLVQDSSSKALTILYILGPVAVVILTIIIILIILMRKVFVAKNIKFCFRNITQKGKAELENDFRYVTYLGHEIETQSDRNLHRTPDTRHKEYAKAQNRSVKDIFQVDCNGLDTLTTENEYENNDTSQMENTTTDIFDTEYLQESGSKCNNDKESHYDTMVTFGRTPKNFQSYFQEKNNRNDVEDINLRKEFGEKTQNGIQEDLDQTYDYNHVDTEQIKQNDYSHLMEKPLKSSESKEICGCECVNAAVISKIDKEVCYEHTVASEAGSQSIGQSTKL